MKAVDLDNQMVVSADAMDDATFIKHYNARHKDRLAGLARLGEYPLDAEMVRMYRIAHDHFHYWGRVDVLHSHRGEE